MIKDLVFTDAPGEWFDSWRVHINDENAKGAKWIHRNSDAFLLFADSETLNGPKRGLAKLQIQSVADRILGEIDDRPFALIWAKADLSIPATTQAQITQHIKQYPIAHYEEFSTSVKDEEGKHYHDNICSSINWAIEALSSNNNKVPQITTQLPEDLFLSKRA